MKKIQVLFIAVLIFASCGLQAQIAITTNGTEPDGSAMLDVQSTKKGLLSPRMSETQRDAISNPVFGLMVYNTTSNCLDFYTGIKWISTCETGVVAQNLPPVASDVIFSGTMEPGQSLTGSYTYYDYESDAEGASTYKWYRADDATGTNQAAISGATALTYLFTEADIDKFLAFEVTPLAVTGSTPGTTVRSDYLNLNCGSPFIDVRDGKSYTTVKIGNQCWMAENLAYLPQVSPASEGSNTEPYYYVYMYQGSDVAEAKATTNYQAYGVLYNWPSSLDACPANWHLPAYAEWTDLTTYLGGVSVAGGKMKETGSAHWNSPNNGATNSSGFTGRAGGYYQRSPTSGNFFYYMGYYGTFWSSTGYSTTYTWTLRLHYTSANAPIDDRPVGYGYSVRCLKD